MASDELNVRYQPLSDSPVVDILVRGDPLQVISVNGDDSWIEVVTPSGEHGWVLTKLVQLNIDLSTVPWNSAYPAPGS
ncbi:MAG: SH3 domain-containing protein [Anaerolineae bacterium]|nr:SH3 domain-containing protein [Anaerolineae bacterium]